MKKTILLLFFAIQSCKNNNHEVITGQENKPLPAFKILLMDSVTYLNTRDIPAGKPTIILFFNPHCPYCRADTKEMIDNINTINNFNLYFISNFPFASIKQYYKGFSLNRYSNITVCQDPTSFFGSYYGAKAVPFIAVYDKNKNLKVALMGRIKINDILAKIKN